MINGRERMIKEASFVALNVGTDADATTRKDQLPITLRAAPIELLDDILRGLQYIPMVENMIALGAGHFLWHLWSGYQARDLH
jgi:hypothetical protein